MEQQFDTGQQHPQQYGTAEQHEIGGQRSEAGIQGSQLQGGQGIQAGGQQFGGRGQQDPQFPPAGSAEHPRDLKLEEGLTDEMRVVLHDFVQSATACEWCAERCIDDGPEMNECLRLCRDVADLATLNIQLMSRDSVFGPEAAQLFAEAAEACAQECARHGHRHCQECAEVLNRAARSTWKMLASFEGAGGIQGQQSGAQLQTGGQQFGGQAQQPGEMSYGEGGQIGETGTQFGPGF